MPTMNAPTAQLAELARALEIFLVEQCEDLDPHDWAPLREQLERWLPTFEQLLSQKDWAGLERAVRQLQAAQAKKKSNITEAIGNTPIVRLNKVASHVKSTLYVKCEFLNPGGSMKDRVALNIIRDAERRGLLTAGGTIVEATSGNTGAGDDGTVTRRTVKLSRPPFGKRRDVPFMMRSTP